MAFIKGGENEQILQCSKCQRNLELDANFCPDCGSPRPVILGASVNASYSKSIFDTKIQSDLGLVDQGITNQFKQKKIRNPSKVRLTLSSKLEKFQNLLAKQSKLVYIVFLFFTIIGSYAIVQTLFFASSNPDELGKKYLEVVLPRDNVSAEKNQVLFPNQKSIQWLPVKYQHWEKTIGYSWKINSSWNGWTGRGKIEFNPITTSNEETKAVFVLPIQAEYKAKLGIFRQINWRAAGEVSEVRINWPDEKNVGILINDIPSGDIAKPNVSSGEYKVFAGPLKIEILGEGFTKKRTINLMINGSGLYDVSFGKPEFGLSDGQVTSIKEQVVDKFVKCLQKKCGSLPTLSTSDFEFDNEPTTYLFVDYLKTSWSDSPVCEVKKAEATSVSIGTMQLSCGVSATANIKWMLYRIYLTYYYDLGFDSKDFKFEVNVNFQRNEKTDFVNLSELQISQIS